MSTAAYAPRLPGSDIVDVVGREVRTNEHWRAAAGWRVYPYDAEADRTRFEPWWFIIKPTDTGFVAWDCQPTDQECEFVMDQALAVYRRAELEARLPGVRPCDLILHADSWHLDNSGHLEPIQCLDRAGLFAVPRPAATVSFNISFTTTGSPVFISIPTV
jgi:hypothetical protein